MPGGVVAQFGVRAGLAAAALIEQHDTVALRVEETPMHRFATGAGAAVQEQDRQAAGVAAFLDIQGSESTARRWVA